MSKANQVFIIVGVLFSAALAGCGNGLDGPVDVPQANRVERKEWKDMTKEEKIVFIQKTPMPEEAKQKEIARINAGQN